MAAGLLPSIVPTADAATIPAGGEFADVKKWPDSATDKVNTFEDITTYNNFYEFGTGKGDPAANADTLKTKPWSVQVTGEAGKLGTFTLEDILKPHALEERIYRHRCVEAWSMVVPWVGFPLADLLKRFEPTSKAKYVQFFSLADREQMPGIRYPVLDWPYREGLTIAEAMHPLTLATVGLYGKVLPNQSGAPLRIVIPWKYGFKGTKSDRAHPLPRASAADELEHGGRERVRLLLEREPEEGSPALEPGDGAAARRRPVLAANSDADVQRLRRAGRAAVHGPRPQQELLTRLVARLPE